MSLSRVVGIGKTIRSNWKKTAFAIGLSVWGYRWWEEHSADAELRRQFCIKAKQNGDVTLKRNQRPTKVSVFLNPAAKSGKARQLFEKNVCPLLLLAGFELNIIKTEYEGQAKKYMEILSKDDCDVVIIAAGDGTLQEVVSGLMKSKDTEFVKKLPIGIIPLGETNKFAGLWLGNRSSKQYVKWLIDSTMLIINGVTKPVDVLQITGDNDKTIYALSGIEWGRYIDTKQSYRSVWFLGPIRRRWAYIRESIFNWPREVKAEIRYTNPCSGCAKCQQPLEWRWWHMLFKPQIKDYSKIINEDCGIEYTDEITGLEFNATLSNFNSNGINRSNGINSIELQTCPTVSRKDFVSNGWKILSNSTPEQSLIFESKRQVQGFKMNPIIDTDRNDEEWFCIDSEKFEAMPIDVSVLYNKLNFFYPA